MSSVYLDAQIPNQFDNVHLKQSHSNSPSCFSARAQETSCYSYYLIIIMHSMFSFSSSILSKGFENKEGNTQQLPPSKEKIQRYYSDFSMENSNEIQTPQFKDFRSQQPTESLFDSYHHQFSEKNNQLNTLISTCQKLGLDVEYLEDSDGEPCPETPQELKLPPKLQSIPEKQSYQQLDESLMQISFVSYLKKFEGIKENCKELKIAANDTRSFLKECQEAMKVLYFNCASMLAEASQKIQRNILKQKAENQRLQVELSTLNSENTVLEGKLKALQTTVRSLTRQKDEGDEQNRKLHQQLQKLHKKLSEMMIRKTESEQLRSELDKLQIKNFQYQNYLAELQQKADDLEYKLKQSKRDYQMLSHEHRGTRKQLQGQYRKLFQKSLKQITHKIEVQTYYRFKEDKQQRIPHQHNPSVYQSTLLTPPRQSIKPSLSGSFSSARLIGQNHPKDLIKSYNLQFSSENDLELQQRKVQNILDEIKRMRPVTKSSRVDLRKGY